MLEAGAGFDTPGLTERILHHAGDIVVALNIALLLHHVGQDGLAIDQDVRLCSGGECADIRQMCRIDAPVQPVPLVEVEDLPRQLIADRTDTRSAATLEGDSDVVVAEDVGVVGADTASDAGSEGADTDADRRRAEIGDVKTGGIIGLREDRVFRQQSLGGILQVGGDRGAGSAQRRKLAGARGGRRGIDHGHGDRRRVRRQLVDVVVIALVQRESDVARLQRNGHGRGHVRDAGHAGLYAGNAKDASVRRVAIDVGQPFGIGDEVEAAVGSVLGVDVLGVGEERQGLDRAAGDVDRRDPHPLEGELLEVCLGAGPAVGDEGDRFAVRREGRLQVGVLVVRQAMDRHRFRIEQEEIGDAGGLAGEDDGLVVGRPGNAADGIDAGDAHGRDFAGIDVDHAQVVVAVLEGDEGQAP